MANMNKRTYRIKGDYIQATLDGFTFKIENITKDGVVINTHSDNGAEIVYTVPWENIKR